MGKARNVKFGIRIDLGKSHLTYDKIAANRAWSGSEAEFLNFFDRLHIFIYLDRVKLDISNFTNCCNVASTS